MNTRKTEIKFYKTTCIKLIMILSVTLSVKPASTQPLNGGADLQETTNLSNSFEKSDMKPFCFTKSELSDLANYKLDCDLIKENLEITQVSLDKCNRDCLHKEFNFWGVTLAFGLGGIFGALLVLR